jgi:hypothetical protein
VLAQTARYYLDVQCEETEMLKARVRGDLTAYGNAVIALQKHSVDALSEPDKATGFKEAEKLAERAMLTTKLPARN